MCSVVLSFCVCCLCDVCADRGIKVDHSNFCTIFKVFLVKEIDEQSSEANLLDFFSK